MTPRAAAAYATTITLGLTMLTACTPAAPERPQTLTVLAAASLTDVFDQIAQDVERDHDGVDVQTSYAASPAIVAQVTEGAPADVVALAGAQALRPLPPEHRRSDPLVFTTNSLQLAVPPDNPGDVTGLADLARPDLTIVVCDAEVPCGAAAAELFDRGGLDPRIASYEQDVRSTLAKVELGEADVGVVYRTDVAAAGDRVTGVDLPAADNVVTAYPIVTVSDHPLAQEFVDEVRSPRGQRHLAEAGFVAP